MSRERDIRQAVHDLLKATGEFHHVYQGGFETPRDRPSSAWRAVAIQPMGSQDISFADAAMLGDLAYDMRLQITVAARHDDPLLRDEQVEHLLEVVKNALNGQVLGGLTNAQFTRIRSWTWLEAWDVERRIVAILNTQYYEPGWAAGDVADP